MSEQPGAAPTPPPTLDGHWAARIGLVRPQHGRLIAGVCAAIGRATKTDPLLWRVILGVLVVFGGAGIIIYVGVWLLTPADGDTAAPAEAALGRGHSSTSTGLAVVLAVLGIFVLAALTDSGTLAVLAAAGLIVAALVANRGLREPAGPPPPMAPPGDTAMPAGTAPPTVTLPVATPETGHQAPFAPHGPYPPSDPPLPAMPVVPPPPAVPKPPPSRLGRVVFGLMLIALGGLGIADLAGAAVPAAAYVAVALTVVGLGLIAGAWLGRARGLIALGIVLSLILPVVSLADAWEPDEVGHVTWKPAGVEELEPEYKHRFGDAELDLSEIDFAGEQAAVEVTANIQFGHMIVKVPENTDVTVERRVRFGGSEVFGQETGGASMGDVVIDRGTDGVGGGELTLYVNARFGFVEVTR